MLELCTLASGSSGNSALLTDGRTHLLLDAGISARRICTALRELGVEPGELAGILITHEHSDHISGLTTLTKHFPLPIYASEGTARQLDRRIAFIQDRLRPFKPGDCFEIGGVGVETFSTPHDAAQSTGYAFTADGRKAAVVTDLGHVTAEVVAGVEGCHLLMVEANHDEEWLCSGPYPFQLKRRILGDYGHLSNEAGGELACRCVAQGAAAVILGHLSAENNTPARARDVVGGLLRRSGADLEHDVELEVAPRATVGRRHIV